MNILENYLNDIQLNEETEFLSEDIKSVIGKLKSLNIQKTVDLLKDASKAKNLGKVKSIVKSIKLPNVSMEKIKGQFKKTMPGFERSYKLSQKVIKNSVPKLPDKNVDVLATVIAAKSNFKSNKPMDDTKENLTKAVSQVRKYIGEGTSYEGGNLGTIIFVLFIIGSIIAGMTTSISIPVLVIVGLFLLACKTIFE